MMNRLQMAIVFVGLFASNMVYILSAAATAQPVTTSETTSTTSEKQKQLLTPRSEKLLLAMLENDPTKKEYFQFNRETPPPMYCEDLFGSECLQCQDFDGCLLCASQYDRVFDEQEQLYYCQLKTDAPTTEPTSSS